MLISQSSFSLSLTSLDLPQLSQSVDRVACESYVKHIVYLAIERRVLTISSEAWVLLKLREGAVSVFPG